MGVAAHPRDRKARALRTPAAGPNERGRRVERERLRAGPRHRAGVEAGAASDVQDAPARERAGASAAPVPSVAVNQARSVRSSRAVVAAPSVRMPSERWRHSGSYAHAVGARSFTHPAAPRAGKRPDRPGWAST